MKKESVFQAGVAVLMLGFLLYGRPINVPDNMQTLHGFPLVWGNHQLVTIAGPVDYWMVNITNLAVDLVIWLAIIVIIPYLTKTQ